MREKVLHYVKKHALLRAGDRVAVAVSGGADSIALLRALLELQTELGIVLSIAHFNHALRGEESIADEAFVAELANAHGLEFFAGHGNVRDHALTSKLGLEAAGRELRYRWFEQLAREQRLDVVATAHTLDDQSETVLLKLLRGAGTKGLAGVYPAFKVVSPGTKVQTAEEEVPIQRRRENGQTNALWIVRPMLCVSREEVEAFLASLNQSWREDESNLDRRFLRNRVRHDLLPLLEREFNPNIRQVLSDLAEVSRGEEEYWKDKVGLELASRSGADAAGVHRPSKKQNSGAGRPAVEGKDCSRLDLGGFDQLLVALQRRLLKAFAEHQQLALDFDHIEKLRYCALGARSKAELPGGRVAQRDRTALSFGPPPRRLECSYHYRLPIPGEVHVRELGLTVRAHIVSPEFAPELPTDELLSLDLVGPELVLRNWAPGDRFWPAHSRSAEKLKRLFLEKRVPPEERASWPIAVHGSEIIWVRGFPAAKMFCWRGEGEAVRIEVLSDVL